jgi:hypothetical protein
MSIEASDIIAIKRMLPVLATDYLRQQGYKPEEIDELRPLMGRDVPKAEIKTSLHSASEPDPLRQMFMATMYRMGVPYRKLGQLYAVSHTTAFNIIRKFDPTLEPRRRMSLSPEDLAAYQRAFYDNAAALVELPTDARVQLLDQFAVQYLNL